ncbi:MAG: tRNA (N(6)-L-threonylcarbamoyladenosine(37)-C(2))-methylthiotransferase MtaB [Desulfobulbus sp.]|jgi:threonylcarbamoyladenosine tRNA methylthiotransferase MtaB
MKRIALTTLGCKVNQFESAALTNQFEQQGCTIVPFSAEADVYVINTCAVTARAAQQSRQMIRRALAHPGARVVVTGCYAQLDPKTVLGLTPESLVIVGNGNKHLLVQAALSTQPDEMIFLMGHIRGKRVISPLPVSRFPGRTRAYLRIQDGCDNFCSYCIVPYTRGRSRSLPMDEVLEQARIFAQGGYRELVVTGINTSRYGLDLAEGLTLTTLLDRLCRDFPKMRLRLSSIEPTGIDDELLDLVARHANFMPHFHIPLQSGDDSILAQMNRHYTGAEFAAIIHRIHHRFPRLTIGCDVLAGFPGETDAAAETTHCLLADLPIHYLHVFPYSHRPGTLAASLPGRIPGPVKEKRVQRLRELDGIKRRASYQGNVGRTLNVLMERVQAGTGLLQGFSENYLPVLTPGPTSLLGQVAPVRITGVVAGQPRGERVGALEEKQRNGYTAAPTTGEI